MKSLTTAWNHIRRTPYQALAAIMIMMLTFLAITVFSFIVIGSSEIISYFESKPQVTAFFKEEATPEEITTLIATLKQSSKVGEVKFVSKQKAFQIYKEQNKNDPLLLDLVTEDILPASVEISTKRIEDLPEFNQKLKASSIVSEVVFQKDVIETLTQWTTATRRVGITIIVLLALVSVFIMATIIGFKISNKRDEIEIMRLLSATKWYVRWPFIFEGMIYGILGAFIGWLIATGGLIYVTPYLKTFLGSIPLLPAPPLFLLALLGVEVLIAIVLGAYASFLAVLRYLK